MMLTVTAVCVLLCLSVGVRDDVSLAGDPKGPSFFLPPTPKGLPHQVDPKTGKHLEVTTELAHREGVETVRGRMTLAFGTVSVPIGRERGDSVRLLQLLLGGGFAGTAGLLLALVWTSGFLPTFLEPDAVSVLLAKPVPRWQLLAGKYLGVLTFVGFQVVLFVTLTWLALGIRTGVWGRAYLTCIPLLWLQFAIFFSVSVLLAVVTRGTAACVFGSFVFWLLSWGINYGCVMSRSVAGPHAPSGVTRLSAEAAYWAFPKPIDSGLILFNTLDARHDFEKPVVFQLLEAGRIFSPTLSIASSFALAAVLLALAAHKFNNHDY